MADSAMVSAYFFAQKIEEFSSSIFHGNKFTSPFSTKSVLRRNKSATQMKSLRDEILLTQGYKDGFNFIEAARL